MVFLRGINVGGKTIKMNLLKKAFESLKFKDVKTFIASGNIVFASDETDEQRLIHSIEEKLQQTFGFSISVIIREVDYLHELVTSDPFKHIHVTPNLRLYVTFLGDNAKKSIDLPYVSPNKDFQIISMTDSELFSVLEVDGKTTDAMKLIEKTFGKNVTTRNWNTVKKLASI